MESSGRSRFERQRKVDGAHRLIAPQKWGKKIARELMLTSETTSVPAPAAAIE
jgi:hypothetical protein